MDVPDPYDYLDAAVENRQPFEQVVSYITEHSTNNENLGNTLLSYYMDKMASMYFKAADDVYEPDVGARVLIRDIIIPSMKTDFALDDDATLIVLVNLAQHERKYAEEHHIDRNTSKYKKIYSVIYDELIKRIISELGSYDDVYDMRKHFINDLNMRPTYFDKFLNKCFRYLYDKSAPTAEEQVAFDKMLLHYGEKVINGIKVRRHPSDVLDFTEPEHINFIVSSAFRTLGQRLLETFEEVRATEGTSNFPATVAQFQTTYGPFTKGQLRAIMLAVSPIYAHYITGERIEAGKTLVTPNGNINITDFPRDKPDSAFAAHALRAMLPNYGVKQRQSQIYAPVSAQFMASDDFIATNNEVSAHVVDRIKSLSDPSYRSHPSYVHAEGYEPPENIGNYARTEGPARKPAIRSKPANKSRKLRFNNAATQEKTIERYKGGSLRPSTRAHFLSLRSRNNRRPTRRNRHQ